MFCLPPIRPMKDLQLREVGKDERWGREGQEGGGRRGRGWKGGEWRGGRRGVGREVRKYGLRKGEGWRWEQAGKERRKCDLWYLNLSRFCVHGLQNTTVNRLNLPLSWVEIDIVAVHKVLWTEGDARPPCVLLNGILYGYLGLGACRNNNNNNTTINNITNSNTINSNILTTTPPSTTLLIAMARLTSQPLKEKLGSWISLNLNWDSWVLLLSELYNSFRNQQPH